MPCLYKLKQKLSPPFFQICENCYINTEYGVYFSSITVTGRMHCYQSKHAVNSLQIPHLVVVTGIDTEILLHQPVPLAFSVPPIIFVPLSI